MAASKQDRLFALRLNAFEDAVSRRLSTDIRKEKNRYIDAQIAYYRRVGMLSQNLETDHFLQISNLYKKNVGRLFYGVVKISLDALPDLKSRVPRETKLATTEDRLSKWYRLYSASKIKKIAGTTTRDLRRLMSAAFNSGEPERNVIKAGLLAKQISAFRADTIARTETGVAASYASSETIRDMAQDVGVKLFKVWIAVNDDRTRPDHTAADGKMVGNSEMFNVGGELLDRPKDPNGSAENVINCRCQCGWKTDF